MRATYFILLASISLSLAAPADSSTPPAPGKVSFKLPVI